MNELDKQTPDQEVTQNSGDTCQAPGVEIESNETTCADACAETQSPALGLAEAADILYPGGVPEIYTLKNFALTQVEGADMTYAEYVSAHSSEWTNIMTNLGFYWADASNAAPTPDWDNLDWATLTQEAAA